MSSRKKKKKSRAEEAVEPASSEEQSTEQESSDEEPAEESGEQPEAPEADEPEPQPAVSEISELKPRRKRKRAKDEEPEPDHAAVETVEVEASEPEEEEEEDELSDTAKEAPKSRAQLKRVIESLIFVSDQVITAQQLGRITKTKVADVREVLSELTSDYETRGIDLIEVNGGYQFRSSAGSAPYVRVLVAQKPVRLTRAQLETLALIAYRQPITRPEVDDVRGVDSGSAIKVLLDRDLIKILGRKDDAGRPLLYGTTPFFLEFFGMNTMQELPTLREFTELSDEHRELFKAKTNDIGDPSAESEFRISNESDGEPEVEAESAEDAEPQAVDSEAEVTEVEADGDVDSSVTLDDDDGGDHVQVAVDDQVDDDVDAEDEVNETAEPDPALSSEPEADPEPDPDQHT